MKERVRPLRSPSSFRTYPREPIGSLANCAFGVGSVGGAHVVLEPRLLLSQRDSGPRKTKGKYNASQNTQRADRVGYANSNAVQLGDQQAYILTNVLPPSPFLPIFLPSFDHPPSPP